MATSTRFALAGLLVLAAVPIGTVQAAPSAPKAVAPAKGAMTVRRLDPALDKIIAPGTMIERLATGFIFAEGPVWYKGRLLFADLPASRIIAMTPDGKHSVLIENSGGPTGPSSSKFKGSNGMVVDKDGKILAVQHAGRKIMKFGDDRVMSTYLDRFEGKRFNSPNDLVFAPDGALWFTDPPYGLSGQDTDPAKEVKFNGVYRYHDGKLTAAIRTLPRPNGIGFSPNGKVLYVANSEPEMAVWRYDVATDGSVSNGKPLLSFPGKADDVPDGLKVDAAGNVWASGPGGIRIITPQGKVLGQIVLPDVAANLAWADGGKTAYITASTSIYRIKLAGAGRMPLYTRP